MAEQTNEKTTIYTIGHSTMPAEDFIGILKDH